MHTSNGESKLTSMEIRPKIIITLSAILAVLVVEMLGGVTIDTVSAEIQTITANPIFNGINDLIEPIQANIARQSCIDITTDMALGYLAYQPGHTQESYEYAKNGVSNLMEKECNSLSDRQVIEAVKMLESLK